MAGNVNVKMGVSGVAQFKQDINAVKQSLKTMETQLALTEKEFKATGDAETYLKDKAEELNAKLQMQESILKKAEEALASMNKNGVDKSSKTFQDMQREVLNAKAAILDTKTEIAQLGTDAGTAATETDKMNTELKNIGKGVAFENVTSGLKNVIDQLEKGAKAAVNFGKKIVKSAMDSTGWADDILTTATKYGTDADTIQRMRNVAEFIDTDVDTILNAKSKLAKNKSNLADLIGIEANGMSVDEAFWKAGAAISAMTDEFKQEEAAQSVFGRGWRDLVPLFTAGQEEYNRLMAEQNVLTNEQVEKLGKADDAFKQVQQEVQKLKNEFWAENADKITELLQWVVDHKEPVVTALGAIATAFGALKLGEAATNVMTLINGLKSLGFGGAASAAGGAGGGGVLGGIGGKVAASGALVPAAVVAAAVAPAIIAQRGNEATWAEQRATREAAAAKLTGPDREFLLNAAAALDNHYRLTGDSASALKGLQNRGDIEKAQLFSMLSGKSTSYGNYATDELLRFWQDDSQFDQARTDALLTSITDAYANMTEHTAEITASSDEVTKASAEMTAAAVNMMTLPSAIQSAVSAGMSGIVISIDGSSLVNYVNKGFGRELNTARR